MDTRLYSTVPPPASNTHVENALTLARTGRAIDRSAALLLVKQAPLPDLLRAATSVRACGKGTVVTYSRKVFIPLTTLCRDYCGYCTFRKDPGQPGALFMTPEEVLALASVSVISRSGFFRKPANSSASRAIHARSITLRRCVSWSSKKQACFLTPIPVSWTVPLSSV